MLVLVRTPDGRALAAESRGDPEGSPVFLLHGTPGSRMGPAPRGAVLHRLGVRLVVFDRPGYGDSDRLPGRRVADAAADVAAVADALGLERFSVVGRSGGGPHALACAALLPDRVTRAGVLVSLAPRVAPGLDWFAGMAESNVREYSAAAESAVRLASSLEQRSRLIRADPTVLVAALRTELPESDLRVVADAGIRAMLVRNYAEALRESADGWIDDALAFSGDWGFDPGAIRVPVLLWHGQDDVFSPAAHTRWLAERIPGSTVEIEPGAAHFGALPVLPRILGWATGQGAARPEAAR
ncbi:alpha/beta fold hydrolase [Streptacidiphilus sp. ASG 303]|uniref:alpha/beta fold hydrolase n=1 Tax=Streptomycetaceae TaxID=2062 RepID=UPI001E42F079|nr:alpha/beta hydrolase [Streptacidiphilus sp. ASG 303]MCD0482108.1 alpha/beta hydrolase [Streptacidiphilus sp. ASG 303]